MFDKGLGSFFKQAQEMQEKVKEVHRELSEKQIEASTGGGMVKIVGNGVNEILSVEIDEELINMKDKAILEDLMTAAINEVNKKSKELLQKEMGNVTGGFKIPGLF